MVNFVNGGPAKPTFVPPRPFQKGVYGRPTLIQNVETLAHLALVARYGADWYRSVGSPDEPGTALVTVSGAVARPCVVEIAIGTPVREVIVAAGGVTETLSAVLVGGYYGCWVDALEAWDAPLSRAGLGPLGASPGCGVLHALPANACGVVTSARIARYLAEETAGQCGPCVNGLHAIATALERVARRDARPRHAVAAPPLVRAGGRSRRVPLSRRRGPLRAQRARGVRRRDRRPHAVTVAATPARPPRSPCPTPTPATGTGDERSGARAARRRSRERDR